MKKFLAALFLFQLPIHLLYAQAPLIEWQKCFGSPNYDNAFSIETTSDGGSIFAGVSYGNGGDVSGYHGTPTSGDFWVVKLAPTGVIQWSKCLGGSGNEQAAVVRQAADGTYVVAGKTFSQAADGDVTSINHGYTDFWVVKLSSTGSILWQQSFGGEADDYLTTLQLTPDGGYILGGYTMSTSGQVSGNHGGTDGWVVKLSSAGAIDWQRCLGGSGLDLINGIQVLSDGYIAVGNTSSNDGDVSGNHGGQDAWAVRLDNTGNIVWARCLGGSQQDDAADVQKTADGAYLLAGSTSSNDGQVSGNHGQQDMWAVKLDNTGALLWQQCYGGSSVDRAMSAVPTADGGYLLAGQVLSGDGQVTCPTPASSGWVIKISATGALLWQKVLGGNRDEALAGIRLTTDNGILVCGSTASTDLPGYHPDNSPLIVGEAYVAKLSGVATSPVYTLTVPSPPANICSGSMVTLTTSTNVPSPVNYEWVRDNSNVSVNASTYSAADFANGDQVYARVVYTNECGVPTPLASNIVTLNVSPVSQPVIGVNPDAAAICQGGTLTFTAMVTGGTGSPVYQWLVDGNPVGTGGPTYTSNTLQPNDIVTCQYSDNSACVVPGGNVSSPVSVQINPVVTPAIGISTPATTVCSGSPMSFIAKAVNGGVTPGYQWLVNNSPVGTGGPTYNSNTLSNGDVVSCVLNSSAACSTPAPVTSNLLSLTVNQLLTSTIRVDYSPLSVCVGQPVSFTATPGFAGKSPAYAWQVNGKDAGVIGPLFTTSTLQDGDIVRCILSNPDPQACVSPSDVSVTAAIHPIPVVGKDQSIVMSKGQSTTLNLPVTGDILSYLWTPATGLSDPALADPVATPGRTTVYTLQVQSTDGCVDSGHVTVKVSSHLSIPGAFTPNGDGLNDIFYVIGGPLGSKVKDLAIFSRWGQMVFQVHEAAPDDPAFGWNGTIGGQPASAGTYVYTIRIGFADGTQQIFKGTLVLIR